MKNLKIIQVLIGMFLISANFYIWSDYFEYEESLGEMYIFIMDVGQGDATLIKTPSNHYALIDTGAGDFGHAKLTEAIPLMENKIDLMVGSHADYDHIGGMQQILQSYETEILFISPTTKQSENIMNLKDYVAKQAITNATLNIDTDFTFDSTYWNILWPHESIIDLEENDKSYGIELRYNNFTFVTMGDLSSQYELQAISDLTSSTTSVLKVSHHGSKTSTPPQLLQQLMPIVSIISVGIDNSYGHPHETVLGNLSASSTDLYRTDIDGTIEIRTDGTTYAKIRTDRNPTWQFIELSKTL